MLEHQNCRSYSQYLQVTKNARKRYTILKHVWSRQ